MKKTNLTIILIAILLIIIFSGCQPPYDNHADEMNSKTARKDVIIMPGPYTTIPDAGERGLFGTSCTGTTYSYISVVMKKYGVGEKWTADRAYDSFYNLNNTNRSNGYRLHSMEGEYLSCGDETRSLYAGFWKRDTSPQLDYFRWLLSDMVSEINTKRNQGWRIHIMDSYEMC